MVSSWGRLSKSEHTLVALSDRNKISDCISNTTPGIAFGMGRSYGDVCLNAQKTLWLTKQLDHFISFDDLTGRLVCEAGVLLRDIQRLMIPRGWILPVTPGTQMVTVGGAIANDVHGKNHHVAGSFGNHILNLTLLRTNGECIQCGPNNLPDWFFATVGGLGLTGVIGQAEIQLRRVASPWLNTETIPYANLNEFFQLADASEADWEQTVSWVDCISSSVGRGLFMRGNFIEAKPLPTPKTRKLSIPIVPPISLINKLSLRPFNTAYFHFKKNQPRQKINYYESFFYPLDNLHEWNRMYGPQGFFQYQSVIPRDVGYDATKAMLKEISRFGEGSFLAVLKTFGEISSVGMLSFPQAGVTLALDFPNRGNRTHKLFEYLDCIVREAGGRIYPAKDARMPKEIFEMGYPRLSEFIEYRDLGISSNFSRRLMGN